MKLYLVHCGFYDTSLCDGIFESHVNYFVAAESFETARVKIKSHPEFQKKRMHIDGIQEIRTIDGFRIVLEKEESLDSQTEIISHRHRDLAPKPNNSAE